ncbi:ABC transporter ATP-binding protein [Malaciobacter marinus]|uniref:ABC transporter ATP-binding protein n=1 Tax=Malaciobacter marinus TaxID=505249 RepID=UPI003AFFA63B
MSFIKNILFIIGNFKQEFYKVVAFHMIHSFLISSSSGVLVAILWELLKKEPNRVFVYSLVGLLTFFLLLQLFISKITYKRGSKLTYSISKELRMRLGTHIYELPLGILNKKHSSYYSSCLLQDIRIFENFFSHSIPSTITGIFSVFFILLFLAFLDYRLAFVLTLGILCIVPFIYFANLIVVYFGKKHIEAKEEMSKQFLEYCEGMKYLKSFNYIDKKYKLLEKVLYDFKLKSFKLEMFPGPLILLSFIFCELGFLFMVFYALNYFNDNSLNLTFLVAFLIIGYRLFEPIKVFLVDFLELKYMNNAIIRVKEILELKTIKRIPSFKKLKNSEIKFENVSFSYDNKELLKEINLTFPSNDISVLVGLSGEGKTTILSLIARFWEVKSGEIKLAGVNIKDIPIEELYLNISQVFQDVYLFDDTIYNNIQIAKINASKNQIIEACKKANCLEFIEKLENGFDTKVGEGGTKLSGGEKQRISIARAFLKDAPILLLDEPTSSLDSINEYFVQESIYKLTKNKTVIMIAHKLKMLKGIKNIYVINDKKIAQKGSFELLSKSDGLFKDMLAYQEKSLTWQVIKS